MGFEFGLGVWQGKRRGLALCSPPSLKIPVSVEGKENRGLDGDADGFIQQIESSSPAFAWSKESCKQKGSAIPSVRATESLDGTTAIWRQEFASSWRLHGSLAALRWRGERTWETMNRERLFLGLSIRKGTGRTVDSLTRGKSRGRKMEARRLPLAAVPSACVLVRRDTIPPPK